MSSSYQYEGNFRNPYEKKLFEYDLRLFNDFSCHLYGCSVLKVGTGRGFFNAMVEQINANITHLDVCIHPDADVYTQLYDGHVLPFVDSSFDVVVSLYTLHHSEDSRALLREILRVSRRKIILVETTYSGLCSKARMIINDWKSNALIGQQCSIRVNSYFRLRELHSFLDGFSILDYQVKPHKGYFKEIIIAEKSCKSRPV
jgi:SAM-dependent methyltransferase